MSVVDNKNHSLRHDVFAVIRVAFPAMITSFGEFALLLIQQIFVARIGNEELAAVAVSNTWLNPPLYFILGVTTALDTLGSQAYGAGDKIAIMRHWVESIVSMTILSIPMGVMVSAAGPAARTIFQESEKISGFVGNFCGCALPGLLSLMFGTTVMKVLQTQNMLMAPALVTLFVFAIFIPIQIGFIEYFGFIGSSIALSFVRFIWMVMMFLLWVIVQLKWWKNDEPIVRIDDQIGAVQQNNNITNNGDDSNYHNSTIPLNQTNSAVILDNHSDVWNLLSCEQIQNNVLIKNSNYNYQNSICSQNLDQMLINQKDDERSEQNASNDSNILNGNLNMNTNFQSTNPPIFQTKNKRVIYTFTKDIVRQGFFQGLNLQNVYLFLKLGIAGGLMLITEAFSFDITTAFAARLGTDEVDAHVSLLMTATISYVTFPYSFATAGTILVGNYLGAKKPRKARKLGLITVILASISMVICGILMLIFRDQIGHIFSNDENIISLISSIIFPVAAFQLFDGIQGSCQGALRGMGRQAQLFLFNVLGFWVFGVITEVVLCFVLGLGLRGIWWGVTLGVFVVSFLTLMSLILVNWQREADKIEEKKFLRGIVSCENMQGKMGEKNDSLQSLQEPLLQQSPQV